MISGFSEKVYKNYSGSSWELMDEAVVSALEASDIGRENIDGLITTYLPGVFGKEIYLHFFTDQLSTYLNIKPKTIEVIDFGGPSVFAALERAEMLIRNGRANNILLLFGGKGSLVRKQKATVDSLGDTISSVSNTPFRDLIRLYPNYNPVTDYALVAAKHSQLYGTSDEDRAELVVKMRKNAISSSRAMFNTPISVEDVLSSKVISSPMHLLEIVYPVDGFHAFIVSKKSKNMRDIGVLKYGEAHWPDLPPEIDDITVTPAEDSSKEFREDIARCDVFELYDSFSITIMLQLEDIGLVKKGKVGKFCAETTFSNNGDLPLNTNGGSLNMGQPAYMSGSILLYEALLQLNGLARGNQVNGARKIFLNGIGGWHRSHSVSIILGEK